MVTPVSRSPRTSAHMSRRSSTSTPAVGSSRNRIWGSCARALAIITRRFMPPDSVMILSLALVPQRQLAEHLFDERRDSARGRSRPRLKFTVDSTFLERIRGELLRHRTRSASAPRGTRAGSRARTASDLVPLDGVTIPQTILISVVLPAPFGPRSAKISPFLDLEIDVPEGPQAGGVGLRQA